MAATAAFIYFAAIFAAGFALGVVRYIFLEPRFGELAAVAIELPFMLGLSWIICARLIFFFRIARSIAARALMGGGAFLLLISTEIALATLAFEKSISEIMADWSTPAGALGLLGQAIFGLMPLLQLFAASRTNNPTGGV